ncbi:glycosyltransferase [Synechococcus sp. CC9616]|uniref:glycosyltransferase n=1 Tax=Synechococcus sp. CC9616 TaxID=110663 RepID=UPI0004BBB3D5|nr:glycosyltransferase [Synechococcus sp. CC9616]
MANILFLHPNFPGQFKHISHFFASKSNDVIFLCQTHYGRTVKGVKRLCLKGKSGGDFLKNLNLNAPQRALRLAEQYKSAFEELKRQSWAPDIIISHSGWGCGSYAKLFWPHSLTISYLEWWFNPISSVYTYDPKNTELSLTPESVQKHWLRNSLISLELISADKIVSPTIWQKSQLPEILQTKCQVIFDGIDTNKYNMKISQNQPSHPLKKFLTYGTRGMEPMRGFSQFIRCIPKLKDLQIEIQIAGEDEMNYGGVKPKEGSWKQWAISYLKSRRLDHKVKWIGRLSEKSYINWLQNSSCHVYLTHPYVASWSFVEALHCCRNIVASNVPPVREFCNQQVDGLILTDHRDVNLLAEAIKMALNSNKKTTEITRMGLKRLSSINCLNAWSSVAGLDLATSD